MYKNISLDDATYIYPFLHFNTIIHGLQGVGQNFIENFLGKGGVAKI